MLRRYYLLTEGPDDEQAMVHLLSRNEIPICRVKTIEDAKIAIEHRNGVSNLLSSLRVQLKIEDSERAFDRIGIVIDADADIEPMEPDEEELHLEGLVRRWQAIQSLLRDVGYTDVPERPNPNGTIIGLDQQEKPKVGIWLMPNNQVPGKLENFAQLLIPQDDTLWGRVEKCIQSIPEAERKFRIRDLMKAQIHTWLAWQTEPGKPIGQAITKGFLQADAPHAQNFLSWIKSLFYS